jgi:hypothetical protein
MHFVKLVVDADKNKPVKLHFSVPPKTTNSRPKPDWSNDQVLFLQKIMKKSDKMKGKWEGVVLQQNSWQMKDEKYLGEINFEKGDVTSHIKLAKEVVGELKKDKIITSQDAEKASDDLERLQLTLEGKKAHEYL